MEEENVDFLKILLHKTEAGKKKKTKTLLLIKKKFSFWREDKDGIYTL